MLNFKATFMKPTGRFFFLVPMYFDFDLTTNAHALDMNFECNT